ncbi:hypothetical protein C0Q70_13033 [Pomacea canaliculata]|uniref:Uncharacterized protein n=1 Tax=Pomacea canaliculata TaxID=400727 RepID=A0A2T7P351_POMCA|nr:hypothetical protein C0Q70_13033 [Pomacea canaliculata]
MFPKAKIYSMVWVIISLVALVGLEQSSAVEILDCNPGSPLVVEEAFTNVQIICISIQMGFEVLWHFNVTQENQSTRLRAVHCLRNVLCIGQLPFTSIYRLPHTTALNVTEYIKYFNLTAVTCTERHPYTGKENSYSCSVQIIRVEILDCGPGTPLVVEETTKHFDINCINIHQGFEVFWYLNWTQDNGPMHMKVLMDTEITKSDFDLGVKTSVDLLVDERWSDDFAKK